jgi:hypothetical protein
LEELHFDPDLFYVSLLFLHLLLYPFFEGQFSWEEFLFLDVGGIPYNPLTLSMMNDIKTRGILKPDMIESERDRAKILIFWEGQGDEAVIRS